MMIPGINQAITAEAAVSNKSILNDVNKVMMQQAQQNNPPQSMALSRVAAPVIKVGIP